MGCAGRWGEGGPAPCGLVRLASWPHGLMTSCLVPGWESPGGAWGWRRTLLLCSASSLSLLSSSQVVFPPGSPVPLRRTFSVLASPPPVPLLQQRKDSSASSPSPPPSLPAPSSLGPSALARGSPGDLSAVAGLQEEGVKGPTPPPPVPQTWRSVGCQTDEDPLFPPMQAGLPVPVLLPGPCPSPAHLHVYTLRNTLFLLPPVSQLISDLLSHQE